MKLHLDVRVLKGAALALAVVLVVLVGLLCLKRWDESRGQLAESDAAGESPTVSEDSREVTYVNGRAYALRDLETFLLLGVDKFEGETPEGYSQQPTGGLPAAPGAGRGRGDLHPHPAEPGHYDPDSDFGRHGRTGGHLHRPTGLGPHLWQWGRGQL